MKKSLNISQGSVFFINFLFAADIVQSFYNIVFNRLPGNVHKQRCKTNIRVNHIV